jgi:hypothetical protein
MAARNDLLPTPYEKKATSYMKQIRKSSESYAWGQEGKNYLFAESLGIVCNAYLKVHLTTHQTGYYKAAPGFHIVKTISIRCNGDLAYSVDMTQLLKERVSCMSNEEALQFVKSHMGYIDGSEEATSRTCYIPIPLPHASVWQRNAPGSGVLPFRSFANSKIEAVIDFYDNTQASALNTQVCPAFNQCQMWIKEAVVPSAQYATYSDARGAFSVVGRKLVELTSGWTSGQAGVEQNVLVSSLTGCVTELVIQAHGYAAHPSNMLDATQCPYEATLTCDQIDVVKISDESEFLLRAYGQGFRNNNYVPQPCRIVFGSHGIDSTKCFQGAINFSAISEARLRFKFESHVNYKVFALVLVTHSITNNGRLVTRVE